MKFTSILAIYFLFFCFSAFALLPFGVRTSEELGEAGIPGQADSAPHAFDPLRHFARAALLALFLFALYYANWKYGWIGIDDLDLFNPPEANAA